ncbi:MAG: response regulator [Oscillatoriales cyanobacterium]|jgi:twitching motility two-component system response regulator PilG|nr:MAG: response regulator [Oscillatoriales cyanobacterium]
MTDNPPAAFMTEKRAEVVTQPKRVLSHIVGKSLSGCLTFQDLRSPSTSWQLYVRSGQLAYATSATRRHERLQCLVRGHQDLLAQQPFPDDSFEYSDICTWWHSNGLPMAKLRQLLMRLSLEALVQILALPTTCVTLNKSMRLNPVLIETPLVNLPAPLLQMASQWQQWGNFLSSPYDLLVLDETQHLVFNQIWQGRPLVFRGQRNVKLSISSVMKELRSQRSVYQISTSLGVSVNNLVAWAIPYTHEGVLSFLQTPVSEHDAALKHDVGEQLPSLESEAESSSRLTIACIDDSKTVQKHVKGVLEMSGYDVLGITEPTQALTALVRQRPAVILMDVNMPDIDGYELCSMLRQSRQLRDIPIVMLTGRDGILDRLRAKTLGVEYYLTKPFNPDRLVESIQKAVEAAATTT